MAHTPFLSFWGHVAYIATLGCLHPHLWCRTCRCNLYAVRAECGEYWDKRILTLNLVEPSDPPSQYNQLQQINILPSIWFKRMTRFSFLWCYCSFHTVLYCKFSHTSVQVKWWYPLCKLVTLLFVIPESFVIFSSRMMMMMMMIIFCKETQSNDMSWTIVLTNTIEEACCSI